MKPLSASVAADHEVVRVDGHVAHAEDANLVRCQSMVLCVVREAREKVVARVNCLSCLVNFECVYLYNSIRWQVCVRVCSVCVSALLISQFILHVHETYLADALDALHGNYVSLHSGEAETIAASTSVTHALYWQQFMEPILDYRPDTTLFVDSTTAESTLSTPIHTSQMKHIRTKLLDTRGLTLVRVPPGISSLEPLIAPDCIWIRFPDSGGIFPVPCFAP